jgi:hypothetical protein
MLFVVNLIKLVRIQKQAEGDIEKSRQSLNTDCAMENSTCSQNKFNIVLFTGTNSSSKQSSGTLATNTSLPRGGSGPFQSGGGPLQIYTCSNLCVIMYLWVCTFAGVYVEDPLLG